MLVYRWGVGLPLLLTVFTPCAVPTSAAQQTQPALRVLPGNPRQGDALFLRLSDPAATAAEATWRKRTFPLVLDGEVWRAVVPISPDTPAGGHTLTVSVTRDGQAERLTRKIEVARVRYPVQRLRMARRTASLYNYPGVEKEDAAIRAACRTWSEERLWRGDWALPAKGRLSTPFGVRRLRNGRAVGRHRGLDVAAPTGTPVYAPATGRVVLAHGYKKHGNTVILDHGLGVTSLYIHLSAIAVRKGQAVSRGTLIGRVGSTGVSTGPHLHWSVYVQGDAVSPQFFTRLSKRGVTG